SGCGRLALALRNADVFEGTYTGIDVDREMVEWCNDNLGDARFRFLHADIYNELYNPGGSREPYEIPLADSSQQLVTSNSLLTHLLDEDLDRYLEESHRVLEGGGHMAMSVFCIDDMRAGGGLESRWTFEHRIGRAFVESLEEPEAAVAYERGDLEQRARALGFNEASVRAYEPQSLLVARK
ncbi:MAG: class I SAM-dependent methyltransferase, partial [Pseudonocardiaceae bacterium]